MKKNEKKIKKKNKKFILYNKGPIFLIEFIHIHTIRMTVNIFVVQYQWKSIKDKLLIPIYYLS